MKNLLLYLALILTTAVKAQDTLPVVHLPGNNTLHFISPEPIQYVDISSKQLTGDLPLKNVLRIRLKDSVSALVPGSAPASNSKSKSIAAPVFKDAIVTIAGEKYIAQYNVVCANGPAETEVEIMPADTRPLDIAGIGFSQNQLKAMALSMFTQSRGDAIEKVSAYGIKGSLNHVYSVGDYLFLDLSYHNKTRLKYDVDDFRFSVDDRKVTKASNVQSVAMEPAFVLYNVPSFEKYYRNIFVFKKMSFPGNKLLHIELSEKQLSGRVITLGISYQDILSADTFPN